jgi:hypothetical protein
MFRSTQKSHNFVEEALHLKVSDAPQYPFINQAFDIHISLVDDTGRIKVGREMPMTIKLKYEDGEECLDNILEIDRLTPGKIHSNGKAIIRVKLTSLSANYGDRRFVIVASPLQEEDRYIAHTMSTPMACVRYRLALDNVDDVPSLWFKDQGGKMKSIDLKVKLVGPNGTTVVGKMVPLRLELRYSNGDVVPKQEILEATRDSRMMIGENGSTMLRTRINEVSMRHQGKLFSIYVHPDTRRDPLSCDISPASTQSIEIRSKVTPKNKRSHEEHSVGSSSPVSNSSPPSNHCHMQQPQHFLPSFLPLPMAAASTGLCPDASYGSLSMPPSVTGRAATSTGFAGSGLTASRMMNGSSRPQSVPHSSTRIDPFSFSSQHTGLPALPTTLKTVAVPCDGPSPSSIYEWADMVAQHLDSLKWKQIGLEKDADAMRPVYEMANPNSAIDHMIEKYALLRGGAAYSMDETSGDDEEEYEHRSFRRKIAHVSDESALASGAGPAEVSGATRVGEGEEEVEHDLDMLPEGIKLGSSLSRDNSLYLAVGDIWQ